MTTHDPSRRLSGERDDWPLEPEGSVPVSGFSRELRIAEDVERFRFSFALFGAVLSPVHLVFSRSLRVAEIKSGDTKVKHIAEVTSAEEARERWIAWWRAGHRPTGFVAPRRTGRWPEPPVRHARP